MLGFRNIGILDQLRVLRGVDRDTAPAQLFFINLPHESAVCKLVRW